MTRIHRILPLLLCASFTAVAQDKAAPEKTGDAAAPTTASAPETVPADHKLKVQDRLVYEVKEDPVPPASGQDIMRFVVTPLGELRFPISRGYGEAILINVLNRNIGDVKSELKQKLEADYYEKATVYLKVESTLELSEGQKAGRVFFYGEAKGSLPLPTNGSLKLCDGLLTVGYSEWSNLKSVKIHRLKPDGSGERETLTFNADAVLNPDRKKTIPPDFELMDGDRIQVEEASFKFFK